MKNCLTVYQTGVSKHLHYSCQALTLKSCVSPCTAYNCMCPALPFDTMASDRGSYSMSAGNGLAWGVGRMQTRVSPWNTCITVKLLAMISITANTLKRRIIFYQMSVFDHSIWTLRVVSDIHKKSRGYLDF